MRNFVVVQDQVIATRVYKAKIMNKNIPSLLCRVCGQAEETILHLLSSCPSLAVPAYLYRHNLVASVLHWDLSKVYSLPLRATSWFTHKPPPVVEYSKLSCCGILALCQHLIIPVTSQTLSYLTIKTRIYYSSRFHVLQTLMFLQKKMRRFRNIVHWQVILE